jgi:hypothetical protein
MIGKFISQILYPDDTVTYIENVSDYIFSYIYFNYSLVDSILLADSSSHALSGSITSDHYYSLLWDASKGFTTDLFKRAGSSLATLIYTAWVEAGSPVMPPYALDELMAGNTLSLMNLPNPFISETWIRFNLRDDASPVLLKVYDITGNLVEVLQDGYLNTGMNEIRWDARRCKPGVYYISLIAGSDTRTIKAILFN